MIMHNSNCYVFDSAARRHAISNILWQDQIAKHAFELFLTRLPRPTPMGGLYEVLMETIVIEMAREALSLRQALRKDGGPSNFPLPPTFEEKDMGTLNDFPEPTGEKRLSDDVAKAFEELEDGPLAEPARPSQDVKAETIARAIQALETAERAAAQEALTEQAKPQEIELPAISLFVPAGKAGVLSRVIRNGLVCTPGLDEETYVEIQGIQNQIEKLARIYQQATAPVIG